MIPLFAASKAVEEAAKEFAHREVERIERQCIGVRGIVREKLTLGMESTIALQQCRSRISAGSSTELTLLHPSRSAVVE
jgi:hypothetical protein